MLKVNKNLLKGKWIKYKDSEAEFKLTPIDQAAIEDIKKLCKETNCVRNEQIEIYREFETEDVDIDDVIIKFGRINKKNLQKNDRGVSSQRMDLYLKKRLNNELNDIYEEQEAILRIEGDDDERD